VPATARWSRKPTGAQHHEKSHSLSHARHARRSACFHARSIAPPCSNRAHKHSGQANWHSGSGQSLGTSCLSLPCAVPVIRSREHVHTGGGPKRGPRPWHANPLRTIAHLSRSPLTIKNAAALPSACMGHAHVRLCIRSGPGRACTRSLDPRSGSNQRCGHGGVRAPRTPARRVVAAAARTGSRGRRAAAAQRSGRGGEP